MAKRLRILGPDGAPIATSRRALAERSVRPTVVGFRRAQQWRSVITGLTPQRLRHILHSVAQGAWTPDFFELAEEMEERDLHYRGVLQQRKLKAAGAPMDVIPASDDPADQAIADDVRAHVLHGRGAHDARVELLDAVGKGVSCQEIVWAALAGRTLPGVAAPVRAELVRTRIEHSLAGPDFRWFLNRPRPPRPPRREARAAFVDSTPVAAAPERLRASAEVTRAMLYLTGPVADKQWRRHGPGQKRPAAKRTVPLAWWADVQAILDSVAPRREPDGRWVYDDTGRGRRLVVERAADGRLVVVAYYPRKF